MPRIYPSIASLSSTYLLSTRQTQCDYEIYVVSALKRTKLQHHDEAFVSDPTIPPLPRCVCTVRLSGWCCQAWHHRSSHDQSKEKGENELGLPEDADEYDLDVALNNNTDAGITKIIAGSFILVMLALLVVGLVIPSITDYGEGVCSPIQNGGRC
eukprot:scaffold12348_cov145-Skeletonema_menzelii.AAC.3